MPDANHVESALEDTFLIVQDAFRSDTVELADVVLPAATWGESEGTVMNMERRVSSLGGARAAGRRSAGRGHHRRGRRPCRFGSVRFDAARPRSAVRRGQRPDARHDGRPLGDLLRAAVRGAGRPVARPDETGEGGYRYYDGDGADAEDARDATPTTRTADGRSRPTRAERGSRTRLTGACRSRSTRRTPSRSPPAVVRTRTTPGSGLGLTLTTTTGARRPRGCTPRRSPTTCGRSTGERR